MNWQEREFLCPAEASMTKVLLAQFPFNVALGMLFHRRLVHLSVSDFYRGVLQHKEENAEPSSNSMTTRGSTPRSWRRRCLDSAGSGHPHPRDIGCLLSLGYLHGTHSLQVVDPPEISVVISVTDEPASPESWTHAGPLGLIVGGRDRLQEKRRGSKISEGTGTTCVLAALMQGAQVDVLTLLWTSLVVPWLGSAVSSEAPEMRRRVTDTWGLEASKWGVLPVAQRLCPAWLLPYEPSVFPMLLGCMRKTCDGDQRCGCDPGRRRVLEYLLSLPGTSVNSCDDAGATLLIEACRNDCIRCVEYLCHPEPWGADVNLPDHNDIPPLSWAAASGSVRCIQHLVKIGAELEARTRDAEMATAVHYAAYENQPQAIVALRELGADVRARTGHNKTAAGIARLLDFTELYELLLSFD